MIKHTIHNLTAREILDSRGQPTLEVKIELGGGIQAVAAVPSGTSTGAHEAAELRDTDSARYGGVLRAVQAVNDIIGPQLKGAAVMDQTAIDAQLIELDGTPNKSRLGANALLAVSLACARVTSLAWHIPLYRYLRQVYKLEMPSWTLPQLMMNFINGAKHADTNLPIQEIMVIPRLQRKAKGQVVTDVAESVRVGAEIFHHLGQILKNNNLDTDLGFEGGYAPNFQNTEQAFDLFIQAVKSAGFKLGSQVAMGLDMAASEFYKSGKYQWQGQAYSVSALVNLYADWMQKYPLTVVEDGLDQDDWDGWKTMTETLGSRLLLVGDDLFVTNSKRLAQGARYPAANAIIIKPNQVGTLTETINTVKLAQKFGYQIVVSHRSGETTDDFIADLAVAVAAEYIKAGSVARGERVAKYNRLMAIELELFGSR